MFGVVHASFSLESIAVAERTRWVEGKWMLLGIGKFRKVLALDLEAQRASVQHLRIDRVQFNIIWNPPPKIVIRTNAEITPGFPPTTLRFSRKEKKNPFYFIFTCCHADSSDAGIIQSVFCVLKFNSALGSLNMYFFFTKKNSRINMLHLKRAKK